MYKDSRYRPADKFITINENDPFIQKIDIPMPEPPDLDLIEGYGLDPYDQIFVRPKIPEALVKIGQDYRSIDEKWLALENQRHNLKKEIEWLKRVIYYHVNGGWFFINGKPTYFPPAFYDSVAFLRTHTGLIPQVRERSRRLHLVMNWAEDYHYDFKEKNYDAQGQRLPNKYGDELVDVGERTMIGVIYGKGRRLSATFNAIARQLNKIHNFGIEDYYGMQAETGVKSKKLWQKWTTVWRTVPWFFMPYFDGSDYSPETTIRYRRSQEFMGSFGLGNRVDWANSGSSSAYDGEEMKDQIIDEAAKRREEDWHMAWDTAKKTFAHSEGKVINGFAFACSTAGEFEKGGGKAFLNMIKDSNYYERTESGRTISGLVNYWESSAYGAPGFIDRFGESMHEEAKKHYFGELNHFLQQNTEESLKKYREAKRTTPLFLMDCFMRAESNIGFDQIICDKRIAELQFKKPPLRYNAEWSHGIGSDVVLVENPNGRFINPLILPAEKANRKYFSNGDWFPQDPLFAMHCSDPWNYNETEGRRKSKGAIVGIKRRITYHEDPDEDIKNWKVPDILYTYSNRLATVDEMAMDAIKITQYYGGLHSPEINNPHVVNAFRKHRYSGYLFFFRNDDMTFRSTPGYSKTGNTGNILLTHGTRFMKLHGHRMNYLELLIQCKELQSAEDITDMDLIAAFCGACMSIENDYARGEIDRTATVTYRELFGQR